MALFIDLFENPALLGPTQHMLETLQGHVRIVQGLEHVKNLLEPGTQLRSTALEKCKSFIRFTNKLDQRHSFVQELAKLSLDELAIISIAYPEKRLESIHQHLRASNIRSYIVSQNVKVSEEAGVHRRIAYYLRASYGTFNQLYSIARNVKPSPEGHVPTTADSPWSLEFNTTTWDRVEKVFGRTVMDAMPKRDAVATDCVRSKLSRTHAEHDIVVTLEVGPQTTWLPTLFTGGTAHFDSIKPIFGHTIAEAIDCSQLRNWEKKNMIEDQTKCVELASIVKLRLGSGLDIANTMYSVECDTSC